VKDLIKKLAEKTRNLVKIAYVTISDDDSGIDSISQVEFLGKPTNAANVIPYGLSANPPTGTTMLIFSSGGSSQNLIGVPYSTENRFRNLKAGEVAVGNFMTKAKIFFDENGGVVMNVGKDGGTIQLENDNGYIMLADDGKVTINGHLEVLP